MSITPSWELLSVLSKVFIYLGAASALGGAFCLLNYNDDRRSTLRQVLSLHLAGALLGLQAVAAAFLVQVGIANGSGLSGAFDRDMAGLLVRTQLCDLSLFPAVGVAVWELSLLNISQPPRQAENSYSVLFL